MSTVAVSTVAVPTEQYRQILLFKETVESKLSAYYVNIGKAYHHYLYSFSPLANQ